MPIFATSNILAPVKKSTSLNGRRKRLYVRPVTKRQCKDWEEVSVSLRSKQVWPTSSGTRMTYPDDPNKVNHRWEGH